MPGQRQVGGGKGSGGGMRSGGSSSKSNVTKITNKKTMGKTEVKLRAKTDKVRKSPAAEDIRKGNLDNLKKTFGKPKVTKKNNSPFGPVAAGIVKPKVAPKSPKLNAKAKAAIAATAATANAVRISKNKSKSVPVPRDRKKQ
jgi:hypothetical protein